MLRITPHALRMDIESRLRRLTFPGVAKQTVSMAVSDMQRAFVDADHGSFTPVPPEKLAREAMANELAHAFTRRVTTVLTFSATESRPPLDDEQAFWDKNCFQELGTTLAEQVQQSFLPVVPFVKLYEVNQVLKRDFVPGYRHGLQTAFGDILSEHVWRGSFSLYLYFLAAAVHGDLTVITKLRPVVRTAVECPILGNRHNNPTVWMVLTQ
jgi:hypothetical protein